MEQDQILCLLKEPLRQPVPGISQPELKNNYLVTLASLLLTYIFFRVYVCSVVWLCVKDFQVHQN